MTHLKLMKEFKLEENTETTAGECGDKSMVLKSFRNFSIVLRQTNGVNNLMIALSCNTM